MVGYAGLIFLSLRVVFQCRLGVPGFAGFVCMVFEYRREVVSVGGFVFSG